MTKLIDQIKCDVCGKIEERSFSAPYPFKWIKAHILGQELDFCGFDCFDKSYEKIKLNREELEKMAEILSGSGKSAGPIWGPMTLKSDDGELIFKMKNEINVLTKDLYA